ncbi:MAG: hypothetical protein WDN69_19495 [Aliidongia sp.]
MPIAGLIADQQSSMLAHGALAAGAWKATYGTSAVLMLGTGDRPVSPDRTMPAEALLAAGGRRLFCIEGMVVTAGAFIDWLCTGLRLFDSPAALEAEALGVADTAGVQIRPALQGLGAPHGRFASRALIAGSMAAPAAAMSRARRCRRSSSASATSSTGWRRRPVSICRLPYRSMAAAPAIFCCSCRPMRWAGRSGAMRCARRRPMAPRSRPGWVSACWPKAIWPDWRAMTSNSFLGSAATKPMPPSLNGKRRRIVRFE